MTNTPSIYDIDSAHTAAQFRVRHLMISPEQKDPWGATRIGATASTKISRKDFGLAWNVALEAGGVLIGDEVAITIDLEAVKRQPASTPSGN